MGQVVLNGWLEKMVPFTIIYIHKEQMDGPENDHASQKSHEHSYWIRLLVLIMCKEDRLNL
jgi:hypothetical protein